MATWSGWIQQFLAAANLPDTGGNNTFLGDWNSSADSNCRNNPLDLSHKTGASTNCKALTGSRTAQNYTSHTQAATSFDAQLHSGNFPHLLGALASGSPYGVSDQQGVMADLVRWGSEKFAYELTQNFGPPHGGPGGGIVDADALKGWQDIRHSVNRNMPAALRHSDRQMVRALHALGRARKVKL